ncbi:MAG: phosphatidylglycerophosphatase A [Burkholderiales bacterium]
MIIRPNIKFLLSHPAHCIALGFGTGLAPFAPGTVGTLLGFPLYWLLAWWLSPLEILIALLPLFALGVWACERTGADLGIPDHSSMVWDEVVAFVLILVFTPPGIVWQAFAFFAFRFFDVLKPPPIRQVDRRYKGGFGVMADDILAAGYSLLVMAVALRVSQALGVSFG